MTPLMLPDASPEQALAFDEQQLLRGREQAAAYLRTRWRLTWRSLRRALRARRSCCTPRATSWCRGTRARIRRRDSGCNLRELPTRNHVPVADGACLRALWIASRDSSAAPAVPRPYTSRRATVNVLTSSREVSTTADRRAARLAEKIVGNRCRGSTGNSRSKVGRRRSCARETWSSPESERLRGRPSTRDESPSQSRSR